MQFILLIGLIIFGFVLTRIGWLGSYAVSWGNRYVIYVALPVVALAKIPGLQMQTDLLVLVVTPVLILLGSVFLFQFILKSYFNESERLVLTLTSGLGNCSFVGFPLIVFYFGADSLSYGAIFDQMTFLMMASVGQAMIVRDSGVGFLGVVKKIATFPVFIAVLVALFIPDGLYANWLILSFGGVIHSLSVVAMIIIGYLIATHVNLRIPHSALVGLGYKLVLAPAMAYVVLLYMDLSLENLEEVSILEASMAPQTSICLMLLENNKLPYLVSQILCWGTIISLLTSFLWMMAVT
jgi:hypothetical protein